MDTGRPSVLLVEDDADTRHMYATSLDFLGFDVLQARDGVEGLHCAQTAHPDVVLMDVGLPRMDGLEATRRLKSNPDTASVPVVIISAFTTAQDRKRALEAGAVEFLGKPCDPEVLACRLRRYRS